MVNLQITEQLFKVTSEWLCELLGRIVHVVTTVSIYIN